MFIIDCVVEVLVEKFVEMCLKDYFLKIDWSQEIIDYVLGNMDKFFEMIGNFSYYVYYIIDVFMKFVKKDDGDIFFWVGVIVIYLEFYYFRCNLWVMDGFIICFGNDFDVYGLSGKSKSLDWIGGFLF